jgi:formylglycine-generating enzyme required for sulfatase activity
MEGDFPVSEEVRGPFYQRRVPFYIALVFLIVGCLSGGISGLLIGIGGEVEGTEEPVEVAFLETDTPEILPSPTRTNTRTNTPQPTSTSTPSPTTPKLGVGSTLESEVDGMVMVYVPEGTFQRFISGGGQYGEEMTLNGFWIDQTEVTNAMFVEFLNAEGNQEEDGATWLDAEDADAQIEIVNGEWQVVIKPDHPVVEVTWYGAAAYCEWVGRRLPTIAEWEKASRGEDGNLYPWGNEEPNCTLANYKVLGSNSECRGETSRVGAYPDGASPYGTLDTAGNVWEWVADWFGEDYYRDPSEPPLVPSSSSLRKLIGGSWIWLPSRLFVWNNRLSIPEGSYYDGGFRCARSP